MKELQILIKKELTELFRDKKTLINSIILPTVLIPIIIFIMVKVGKNIERKNKSQKFSIGVLNAPEDFLALSKKDTLLKIDNFPTEVDFKLLVNNNTIQTAIVFPGNWTSTISENGIAQIQVYKNGSRDNINGKVKQLLSNYKNILKESRLRDLNISIEQLAVFNSNFIEVGEKKEVIGKKVGGFIPYIFILTMWGGCLLACVDLVTGEKERKTIETTLSLPVSKFKILVSKTVVASLLGVIPAILNLTGLIVGLKMISSIPNEFKEALNAMVSVQSILLILALLIPFAVFLSSFIISLIAGAATFKEAQSRAAPLIIAIIIPLVIALMPGIDFTWGTVFIPVLNLGLGIKEIMAGTLDYYKYLAMFFSLLLLAVVAIYFSYKRFTNEKGFLN